MGGRAQERLLSSRLVIIAAYEDLAEPLAYLVGAGVGDIDLCVPGNHEARLRSLCAKMRELNPDSTVSYGSIAQVPDLVFALLGNDNVVRFAAAEAPSATPAVIARLDEPGKVAVMPAPPPCIRCASGGLLDPCVKRSDRADFIAMAATTEVLKLLAGYDASPAATLIHFDGPRSVSEPLRRVKSDCSCSNA